ncbi:hypothetical protein J4E86_011192, partial [Alternaria arbusti]|uniref:uncharacterized protein n=1 Tax=Alternaria arbusti TaxID=232088 RepID=UPI00221EE7B9
MSTTIDQKKEAAYTLLSGMLTSVLQKEWKITDRHSSQSALLDALLPKPAPVTAPAPIAPIKVQKQSIFRLGNRTFDLGPEHDSSASSSDDDGDAPIRSARQLKSEMRRVNAIQRRAKRRAERGRRRIEKHLGGNEGVVEFETLKKVEVTLPLKTTQRAAETPVRMLKELEDYNSPARSSLLSDAPMSPRSAEFSSTASEANCEVAEYDGVDSPISEPVQAPGRLRGCSCKACDFTTQYYHSWTRHFRGVMHMEKVARSTQRKGPNIKFVKKAAKSPQRSASAEKVMNKALGKICATEQYCDACDRVLLKCHWKRHAVSAMHAINVKNKAKRDMLKRGSKARAHLENVAKAKEEEESVRLHAPTPESVVLSVEEEEQKEEEEEEYEDDGFGEEGYEDYGHYCDDCDVTYAGAKWARHLTSAGHVFNVIRSADGDEEMASDEEEEEEEEEEESMADYDSATDGESIVFDDATDEDSASPSPSPSPSPSSEEDNVSNEGITFPRD